MKNTFRLPSVSSLLLLSTLAFVAACSSSTDPAATTATSGTFTAIYSNTLSQQCIVCHKPGGTAYSSGVTLDFSSQATAFTTLTTSTVKGPTATGTCGSLKILGATPAASYFMAVLFSDYTSSNFGGVSGCTPYANHQTAYTLSAAEKASIVSWITNGKANN